MRRDGILFLAKVGETLFKHLVFIFPAQYLTALVFNEKQREEGHLL